MEISAYYKVPKLLLAPSLHAKRTKASNSEVLQAKDECFKIDVNPIFKLPYAEFGLKFSPFQLEPDPGEKTTDIVIKNNIYFRARK